MKELKDKQVRNLFNNNAGKAAARYRNKIPAARISDGLCSVHAYQSRGKHQGGADGSEVASAMDELEAKP